MKIERDLVKIDSRNRITIPKKLAKQLATLYRISEKKGTIILEPVQEISKEEKWLFDPKNKAIVDELKAALKQKATIDLGSFKKYLKE
jgi:bifunctional DNA-binding transcriptional regulator/antitoxin component of YhaV-PrlF toxin-antitoxin module